MFMHKINDCTNSNYANLTLMKKGQMYLNSSLLYWSIIKLTTIAAWTDGFQYGTLWPMVLVRIVCVFWSAGCLCVSHETASLKTMRDILCISNAKSRDEPKCLTGLARYRYDIIAANAVHYRCWRNSAEFSTSSHICIYRVYTYIVLTQVEWGSISNWAICSCSVCVCDSVWFCSYINMGRCPGFWRCVCKQSHESYTSWLVARAAR